MPQDIKISELPAAASLTGLETVPLVQSGQTRQAAVATIRRSPGINDQATATAVTIAASGNVGLGVSDPLHRLDMAGVLKVGLSGNARGYLGNAWQGGTAGWRYLLLGSTFFDGNSFVTNHNTFFGSNTVSAVSVDGSGIAFLHDPSNGSAQRTDTGGTFNGYERLRVSSAQVTASVPIVSTVAGAHVTHTTAGGLNRFTAFQTSGVNRWHLGCDGSAEIGNNVGSNIFLNAFSDSGDYRGTPLTIARATGNVGLSTGGTPQERLTVAGNVAPAVDNTHHLGTPALRWNDIYAANAVIQTSDARSKVDVADCPLGLDFIMALRPVRYRFADVDEPVVIERRTVERVKTEPVTRIREEVRSVDGQFRLFTITETVDEPVLRREALFDADGQPLLGPDGNPRFHMAPVTETVEEETVLRPALSQQHRRPHYGLVAQEVKAVLDGLGLDMAGYIYEPGTDRHGLRYGEFVAPLIKAVQDLATRVAMLERVGAAA